MANSSMLAAAMGTAPASFSLEITVASYGGRKPSRMLLPQRVNSPFTQMLFLMAMGKPAGSEASSGVYD